MNIPHSMQIKAASLQTIREILQNKRLIIAFLKALWPQQNVKNLHHDSLKPSLILLFITHLSSKPSSFLIFLIIQRPHIKMIFPKDKRTDLQNKPKTNKSIKPYSILSLGFLKHSDKNQGNRSRQIPDIRQASNRRVNNQNGGSQNFRDGKIEHFSSSTLLTGKVFSQSQENSHCNNIPSSTSIDLPIFDDSVFQRQPLLRLQNLTNQDEEFAEKKLDRLYNCQFISQDQDQQQTSKVRVFVDMKKKIKKLSFGKRERSTLRNQLEPSDLQKLNPFPQKNLHFPFPTRIFLDSQVIQEGSIYRNKLISQRIDNDIDTDDEQIASGVKRLHKSLADAVQEQKRQRRWEEEKQKILESI